MTSNNSYGTTPDEIRHANGNGNAVDEERAALLTKSKEDSTVVRRLKDHLTVPISKSWGDLALLACYVITGLLDSSSVFIWGAFVSMQTGNTIYLGLGVVAPSESNRWVRSATSIGSFCLGSFFFARYHRYLGGRKRWVLMSSFTIQLIMIIIAALMVELGPNTGRKGPITLWVEIPLALIAFQSAGQAVTSRVLQYGSLTSVVLTSIYCDLFSDPQLFTAPIRENPERNRRAASPVLLLIGAMVGGLWAHSEYGLAGALWTAAGLKILIIFAWCLWAAEAPQDQ